MKRIKCTLSYDGTDFSGYQKQPNKRTVQGEIERVLQTIHKGKVVTIHASGRTDTNVHAYGQVIHFDTSLSIPEEKWSKALNALLPNDVFIRDSKQVEESFHARYDTVGKEYRYRIQHLGERDLFKRKYALFFPYSLNIELMNQAASTLIGTHDFSSFCASNTDVINKVRTIDTISLCEDQDELVFTFRGNGFLYNMVRIIVGTLLEVGQERLKPEEVKEILEACDRRKAGKTAPGHGLYLWEVFY
ncbi:tRNA pseudouridine(38-40) synthase TruA [Bacillus carboniphilus]|uniref:tRNA pseudouridine synthase A n=1 Tax=Bacillus carboniphilus TaxID=86663 RepID=A0ABY9JRQ1_9BACI|nr:tRNA pseudouridine(38-40) synthase TruA [Bacillus carboniphilus]WLR42012.1 tRNA pseudouridine(38-40) synthase TruA [Bacillus carboniphilus]